MKPLKHMSLDLFPTHVTIVDYGSDAALNRRILTTARAHSEFNDVRTGKNLLAEQVTWVPVVKRMLDSALSIYLREVAPRRSLPKAEEVDAYMFLNYSKPGEFTPPHNHIGDADVTAIYYAHVPRVAEPPSSDYYRMPGGMFVLHDPRVDCPLDERGPETSDFYLVAPRAGRIVAHAASVTHSVSPNRGASCRLAVVCNYLIDYDLRSATYRTHYSREFAGASARMRQPLPAAGRSIRTQKGSANSVGPIRRARRRS